MGESESAQQSKKRAAVKELSRDNPGLDDEEDSADLEGGTFKRASDEVLASRRIVRVKRKEAPATTSSSNPFAGICLVPPTGPSAETNSSLAESKSTEATVETVAEAGKPEPDDQRSDGIKENNTEAISTGNDAEAGSNNEVNDQETEKPIDQVTDAAGEDTANNCNTAKEADQTGDCIEKESVGDQTKNEEKEDNGSGNVEKNGDGGALSSFQQHSSTKNAFTGLADTGFSSSSFSLGPVSQEGSTGSAPLFGQKTDQPSFSFGLSNNGNSSSLFGASGASIIATKSERSAAFPPKQEVSVETGEENERVAFSADSALFEYLDGSWKERGKGEVKVNVAISGSGGKARLLMRAKGNYRLILNAGLFPDMSLTKMDKKGITFACLNSVGEGRGGNGLSTFALKFKDPTLVEEFRTAVMLHKEGKAVEAAAPLKTPENSP